MSNFNTNAKLCHNNDKKNQKLQITTSDFSYKNE